MYLDQPNQSRLAHYKRIIIVCTLRILYIKRYGDGEERKGKRGYSAE